LLESGFEHTGWVADTWNFEKCDWLSAPAGMSRFRFWFRSPYTRVPLAGLPWPGPDNAGRKTAASFS